MDFRRGQHPYAPLNINRVPVERVCCFKYLGVTISEDLTWSAHTQTTARKANQRLYHLRQLRKFGASTAILRSFYSATVESMEAWYSNSCEKDRKALQRVIRAAERCCGSTLPSMDELYQKSCWSGAVKILKDTSHPGSCLFQLLIQEHHGKYGKTQEEFLSTSR